ncbi:MAG: hypothetical protein ACRCUQ_03495 [Alphaproteobacteria bacterium]
MTYPSSRLIACLTLLWVAVGLSACGKRGEPTTPCQVPSDFPRTYPPEAEKS